MGISILLILFYHTGIAFFGDVGVELFFVLSGIGLTFSLSKNYCIKDFLKKRFVRIIPTYLAVVIPASIIYRDRLQTGILSTIFQIDTIKGSMGFMTWWFIVMICFLYLIAPLLYRIKSHVSIGVLVALLFFFSFGYLDKWPINVAFLLRLPIVVMAIPLGKYLLLNSIPKGNSWGAFSVCLFVSLIFVTTVYLLKLNYIITPWNLQIIFLIYFFAALPLLVLSAYSLQFIEDQLGGAILLRLFNFLGSITLELYLVHEYFCKEIASYICTYWLASAVLSIIIAIFVAYVCHVCMNRLIQISFNDKVK